MPGSTINPNLVESNFLGINNLTNLLGSSTEIPPLTNFSSQIDMSGISSPQEMFITYQFIKNTFFLTDIKIHLDNSVERVEEYECFVSETGIEGTYQSLGIQTFTCGDPLSLTINFSIDQRVINPRRYKSFRLRLKNACDTNNIVKIKLIELFEIADLQTHTYNDYEVEFDDALLDLHGWKKPRYEGCKLVGLRLNDYQTLSKNNPFPNLPLGRQFGPLNQPSLGEFKTDLNGNFRWGGDISYGNNPVINREVCAIYLGTTVLNGTDDPTIVDIQGHAQVQIEKILLINPQTDETTIIDRVNINPVDFKSHIQTDFPEGSQVTFKLLDTSIEEKLQPKHQVKFNEGNLMRLYTYTPNTGGFEDGVFGGFSVRGKGSLGTGGTQPFDDFMKGKLVPNLATGSGGSTQLYFSSSDCGGLFGFGMTTSASSSLFNTHSIDFIKELPDELSQYAEQVNTAILGENLVLPTQSFALDMNEVSDDQSDGGNDPNTGFIDGPSFPSEAPG